MDNNSYYVYAYISKYGTPYYIGKGKNNRAWQKHNNIRRPKSDEQIIILESNLSELGALAIERRMIRWWGRQDIGTGILFNKTEGGDVVSGLKMPPKSRKQMSDVALRNWSNPDYRSRMTDVRRKQSTRSTVEKLSSVVKRMWSDEEYIHKQELSRSDPNYRRTLSDKASNRTKITCIHCGTVAQPSNISRWHNDNCKKK